MGFKKLKNKWQRSEEEVMQNNLALAEQKVMNQLETISLDEAVVQAMKLKFDPSKYQFTPVKPPEDDPEIIRK